MDIIELKKNSKFTENLKLDLSDQNQELICLKTGVMNVFSLRN